MQQLPDRATGTRPALLPLVASRLLQRMTTTPGAREAAARQLGTHDPTVDEPALRRGASTVTGTLKAKLRNRLLLRMGVGGGILVPAIGVAFLLRACFSESHRVVEQRRAGNGAAAGAFAAAAVLDSINLVATARGLLRQLHAEAGLDVWSYLSPPGATRADWGGWYTSWVEDVLALPHAAPLTLTVLGTAAAMAGEVYARHGGMRQFAAVTAPTAAAAAAQAGEAARKGKLEESARVAAAAAATAVDEVMPDLSEADRGSPAAAASGGDGSVGDRLEAIVPTEKAGIAAAAAVRATAAALEQAAVQNGEPVRPPAAPLPQLPEAPQQR